MQDHRKEGWKRVLFALLVFLLLHLSGIGVHDEPLAREGESADSVALPPDVGSE